MSSDIIGDSHSSIVDGLSTMVLGDKGKNVKILSWYDNEWSFVCRLVDLIKFIYKIRVIDIIISYYYGFNRLVKDYTYSISLPFKELKNFCK